MAFFVKHKTRGYYAGNLNGKDYWSDRVRMWFDTESLAEAVWERVLRRNPSEDQAIDIVDDDGTALT